MEMWLTESEPQHKKAQYEMVSDVNIRKKKKTNRHRWQYFQEIWKRK